MWAEGALPDAARPGDGGPVRDVRDEDRPVGRLTVFVGVPPSGGAGLAPPARGPALVHSPQPQYDHSGEHRLTLRGSLPCRCTPIPRQATCRRAMVRTTRPH